MALSATTEAREVMEILTRLADSGDLVEAHSGRGAFVCVPGHAPSLTAEQQQAVDMMLSAISQGAIRPADAATRSKNALGSEVTAWLIEQGALVRLNDVVLLERVAYVESLQRVVAYLRVARDADGGRRP